MAALLSGFAETGLTTAKFVRFRRSDGFVWSTAGTPAFVVYSAGAIADFGIAASEVGATGRYTATDPAETTEGDYVLVKAAGASLVVSDLTGGLRWQDSAGAAPRIRKNTALAAFPFKMVLSSDHLTGATGKTITATRSIDGAAFAACANSVSEVGLGIYKISLAAADLNGDTVVLRFVNSDCDQLDIGIVTQNA